MSSVFSGARVPAPVRTVTILPGWAAPFSTRWVTVMLPEKSSAVGKEAITRVTSRRIHTGMIHLFFFFLRGSSSSSQSSWGIGASFFSFILRTSYPP